MVLDAVSNFVRGNTDAAIASGDTTISVADASIFPDPATDGEFNVVIWDVNNFPRPDQDGDVEIVRVTARDTGTNELTVTRAQEMTSASAHPDGSAIHLSPTAKMFSDIEGTFADFWDADAQQLTGDVNNTNTTTETLEAASLSTDRVDIGDVDINVTPKDAPTSADANEILDDVEASLSEDEEAVVSFTGVFEYFEDESLDLQQKAAVKIRDKVHLNLYGSTFVSQDEANIFMADFDPENDESLADDVVIAGGTLNGRKDELNLSDVSGHDHNGILCYGFNERIRIYDVEAFGWANIGIHYDAGIDGRIINCYSHDNGDIDIHFGARNPAPCIRCVGYGNICENTSVGITLAPGLNSSLIGNTARNSGTRGGVLIRGDRCEAIGNTVTDSTNGITVEEKRFGAGLSEQITISGGNIENVETGVRIEDTIDPAVDGVTIEDADDGVRFENCTNPSTSGNTIREITNNGIFVGDESPAFTSDCDTLVSCDTRGILSSSLGASIESPVCEDIGSAIQVSGDGSTVRNPRIINGKDSFTAIRLHSPGKEMEVVNPIEDGGDYNNVVFFQDGVEDSSLKASKDVELFDDALRTTIGGVGDNGDDDPNTAGDWNGHGYEGVIVEGDAVYQYVNGEWKQIAT